MAHSRSLTRASAHHQYHHHRTTTNSTTTTTTIRLGRSSITSLVAVVLVLLALVWVSEGAKKRELARCPLLDVKKQPSYEDLCISGRYLVLQSQAGTDVARVLSSHTSQYQYLAGMACLEDAAKQQPSRTEAYLLIADFALQTTPPEFSRALRALRRLMQLQPEEISIAFTHATVCVQANRTEDAINGLRHVLNQQPNHYAAAIQLGYLLYGKERRLESLEVLSNSLMHIPIGGETNGMRRVFADTIELALELGRGERAIDAGHQALAHFSEDAGEFYLRLGKAYNFKHMPEMAIEMLKLADSVADSNEMRTEVYFELGKANILAHDLPKSAAAYLRASELSPTNAVIHFAYGTVLRSLQLQHEANEAIRRALQLDPTNSNYLMSYLHGLKQLCDWDALERTLPALLERALANQAHDLHPFSAMLYNFSNAIVAQQARAATAHNSFVALSYFSPQQLPLYSRALLGTTSNNLPPRRRLRVGYVSANFMNHAQGAQLQYYFKHHNTTRFEVFAYSTSRSHSGETTVIKSQVEHWVELDQNDGVAAQRIAADRIDVLIDLCGLIDECRIGIFSVEPSPLQIAFLGYPGTTGSSFMHYLVGDPISTTPELDMHFSETLIIMPHTYQVTEHRERYPAGAALAPASAEFFQTLMEPLLTGIGPPDNGSSAASVAASAAITTAVPTSNPLTAIYPNRPFIFCNFNQLTKLDAKTFGVWIEILKRVPNSLLWLLEYPKTASTTLLNRAQALGVDPSRIRFSPSVPKDIHMARLALADLYLDTPIYNAHTSAGDALWAGLPILTMWGKTMPSRVCASMLFASGLTRDELERLVVYTFDDYLERAVYFASHPDVVARYKVRILRERLQAPLFDTPRFVRNFEKAIWHAWKARIDGKIPSLIDVALLPDLN